MAQHQIVTVNQSATENQSVTELIQNGAKQFQIVGRNGEPITLSSTVHTVGADENCKKYELITLLSVAKYEY